MKSELVRQGPPVNARPADGRPAPRSARLPAIDIYRGCALSLMAAGHGLNWTQQSGGWQTTIDYAAKFLCFPAFLLSFGVGTSVSRLLGGPPSPSKRAAQLRRALTVLCAYYIVAFGKYGPSIIQAGRGMWFTKTVRLVLLLDVPIAGHYFVAFFMFMMVCWLWLDWDRVIMGRPALAMSAAAALMALSSELCRFPVPSAFSGWWRMAFGEPSGPGALPVLTYCPVFLAGLLLGRALQFPDEGGQRARGMRLAAYIAAGVLAASSIVEALWTRGTPLSLLVLRPNPTIQHVLCSGAVCLLLMVLALEAFSAAPYATEAPLVRFISYCGRNTVPAIVCGYGWIEVLAVHYRVSTGAAAGQLGYLSLMLILPPLTVYLAQRLVQAWSRQAHPGVARAWRRAFDGGRSGLCR